nr:hypothetical protein BaRGS_026437 [Batillaria attramentaria]
MPELRVSREFNLALALTVAGEEGPQKEPSATATESKKEQVLRLWEEYGGKNIQDRKNAYQKEVQKEVSFRFRNETIRKLWEKYRPRKFHKPAPRESEREIHALRPADIKVVAAMGDSLTAGTGISADWILEELIENRVEAVKEHMKSKSPFRVNILKNYNPSVYGYALGNGDEFSKNSRFNVAVAGSESSELVEQAWVLIDRMKKAPEVDFENDWKLVTILSGNNDLCDYCKDPSLNSVEYKKHVMAALDILHAEMPRTLVNLVEPLNMEIVTELNKGLLCSALHYFICECAAFPGNEEKEKELVHMADLYQLATEEIAMSGRYDTRDDFTVVCQPFFNQTYVPYDVRDKFWEPGG